MKLSNHTGLVPKNRMLGINRPKYVFRAVAIFLSVFDKMAFKESAIFPAPSLLAPRSD